MKINKRIVLAASSSLSLIALACSNADSIAGGTTTNQNMPTIFMSSGKPAANAVVALFQMKSDKMVPVDQVVTDVNGQYDPAKLTIPAEPAYYNIQIENETETEAVLKNKVYLSSSNRGALKVDTLASVGSINGYVKIQKNHNVEGVLVHALGTNKYTAVDSTGKFSLKGLGQGTYDLQFTVPVYEKYQAKTREMKLRAGSDTTFTDTTEIPYFDIPVVSGVKASFDTLTSTSTVTWDAVKFPGLFKNFVIYRTSDYSDWSGKAIGYTTETTFHDKIQYPGQKYWYRVKVQNTSNEEGKSFSEASVECAHPDFATTTFSSTITHLGLNKVVTEVSKNDSVSIEITASNPTRTIKTLFIGDEKEGTTAESKSITRTIKCLITKDTSIILKSFDNTGKMWTDSAVVKVVEDAPKFMSIDSSATLNVQDTIRVQFSDVFGKVVSYKWKIGNDPEVVTTSPELPLFLTQFGVTEATVTAIDDDGASTTQNITVTSEFAWDKIGKTPTPITKLFIFNDELSGIDSTGSVWSSADGISWNNNVPALPDSLLKDRHDLKYASFNNTNYALITKKDVDTLLHSVLYMYSGNAWKEVLNLGVIENRDHFSSSPPYPTLSVFNGKMYVAHYEFGTKETTDGITWTKSGISLYDDWGFCNSTTIATPDRLISYASGAPQNMVRTPSYQILDKNGNVTNINFVVPMSDTRSSTLCEFGNKIVHSTETTLELFNEQTKTYTKVGVSPFAESWNNEILSKGNSLFQISSDGSVYKTK